MAKARDAFDSVLADIAPVKREPLTFCDFRAASPGRSAFGEVPSFEEAFIRYEFHPLVSAALWLAERFTGQQRRSG